MRTVNNDERYVIGVRGSFSKALYGIQLGEENNEEGSIHTR